MPSKPSKIAATPARTRRKSSPAKADPKERAQRGPYVSDSILARRRRMLDATKQLIAEGDEDSFTIRDLARRADVSVTTIYAAFGDRKGLIAAAIKDYYEDLPLAHAAPKTALSALLAFQDEAREAILSNKAYAREYAELYFSKNLDRRIYKAIQETTIDSAGYLPWLQKALNEGDMIPGMDLKYILMLMANQRLLVLHDWAQGRISDEAMTGTTKLIFLILARGITRGATQARVEAELNALLSSATPEHAAA